MADAWRTYPIELTGGLITNLSPLQQGINAIGTATLLRNFEPSIEGGYRRIQGYSKFDSNAIAGTNTGGSPDIIRGVVRYAGFVIAARTTHLYRSSGSGWTQITDSGSFGSTGVSLSGSGRVRFLKYNFDGNENLFIVDGTSNPRIYDQVANTITSVSSSSLTGADFVALLKGHIFVANGSTLAYSAYLSDTDFTSASGGGIFRFNDTITDLIVFREQLIIFTKNSINRIVGSSAEDYRIEPVTNDLGAIAPDTVQEVNADVVFLGPDGLKSLGATDKIGDFSLQNLSNPIQKEMTDLASFSSVFASTTIRTKSQYRIFAYNTAISDASSQGILGTQGIQGNFSWAETAGIKARAIFSEYENDEEFIYFGNDDGYIYRMESGSSFDGANIKAIFHTPHLTLDDPQLRKTFYKGTVYTDPSGAVSMQVCPILDFGKVDPQPVCITYANDLTEFSVFDALTSVYGSSTVKYSSDNFDSSLVQPLIGSAKAFQLQITTDDTNPPFSLDTIVLEYSLNGRR